MMVLLVQDMTYRIKIVQNVVQSIKKDGQDIPFETFLGFKGDKVPDIDLNFSVVNISRVPIIIRRNCLVKIMFIRAGTIGTVAEKTAYRLCKRLSCRIIIFNLRGAEIDRLVKDVQV